MKVIHLFIFVLALSIQTPVLAQTINSTIENITPDSHYIIHNDGTVTDSNTGLVCEQCSVGQTWHAGACNGTASSHNWEEVLILASEATFAGQSDWRLPNVEELASLLAEDRYNLAINSNAFPSTPAVNSYWTSSPDTSKDLIDHKSLTVAFNAGLIKGLVRNNSAYVRLVRAGDA